MGEITMKKIISIIMTNMNTIPRPLSSPCSNAMHSGQCSLLDRSQVPSEVIDEDDKENMPNESDYEDLPSMYKNEDDEDDDDEDDDEDDDSLFTSKITMVDTHALGSCCVLTPGVCV